jgi:hypothetical protein
MRELAAIELASGGCSRRRFRLEGLLERASLAGALSEGGGSWSRTG